MVETNLVVLEGDWNDGDLLREIRFLNDNELKKFIEKFKEIGELYRRYKEEYDFKNYGDLMNWLEEYGEDELDDPEDYFIFMEENFPYEYNSQTGCKYIMLSYGKVILDTNEFKDIKI